MQQPFFEKITKEFNETRTIHPSSGIITKKIVFKNIEGYEHYKDTLYHVIHKIHIDKYLDGKCIDSYKGYMKGYLISMREEDVKPLFVEAIVPESFTFDQIMEIHAC